MMDIEFNTYVEIAEMLDEMENDEYIYSVEEIAEKIGVSVEIVRQVSISENQ